MKINKRMQQLKLTKYSLSKMSEVPYATISDICNGKTDLRKCCSETVYRLAKALNVTMEELLADFIEERPDFELFKSEVCHRVRRMGDKEFIKYTLDSRMIRIYYDREWYPESLYLLAMVDYLSRINNIPLCNSYDDLRQVRLSETIYPRDILLISLVFENDDVKKEAYQNAIPEFKRYNIVENEVRNVI